jgi:hypothetical protein
MKKKINIDNFEPVSSATEQGLVGGFSASFSTHSKSSASASGGSNNCLGGNCSDLCGTWSNVQCNTVQGCH